MKVFGRFDLIITLIFHLVIAFHLCIILLADFNINRDLFDWYIKWLGFEVDNSMRLRFFLLSSFGVVILPFEEKIGLYFKIAVVMEVILLLQMIFSAFEIGLLNFASMYAYLAAMVFIGVCVWLQWLSLKKNGRFCVTVNLGDLDKATFIDVSFHILAVIFCFVLLLLSALANV